MENCDLNSNIGEENSSEKEYKKFLLNIDKEKKIVDANFKNLVLSRFEVRDKETGKIYCSKSWNKVSAHIDMKDRFPIIKEISEEEAWLDKEGNRKDKYK